ncbi:hypothetical protein C7458_103608 [Williamsia muralis]|nr:hypothetical protein C7458_103608 [Williamsia marianensis]
MGTKSYTSSHWQPGNPPDDSAHLTHVPPFAQPAVAPPK